jgi:hypothetical protein
VAVNTPQNQDFSVKNGTPLAEQLGFFARSVVVDNRTSSYIFVKGAGRWVDPGLGAGMQVDGTQVAEIEWSAPPGKVQIPPVAGEEAQVVFYSDVAPPGTGVTSLQPVAPTVLAAGSVIDVTDRAARLVGVVSLAVGQVIQSITNALDISDRAGRLLGVINSITNTVTADVTDRAGRLVGVISGTVDVSDRAGRLLGIVDYKQVATYRAYSNFVPTALAQAFMIGGSASKTIKVRWIRLAYNATASTIILPFFQKTTAAGTIGVAMPKTVLDSTDPASAADVLCGTGGAVGGGGGSIGGPRYNAGPASVNSNLDLVFDFRQGRNSKPPTLRGVAENLSLNHGALPAGIGMTIEIEWTEEP